MADKTLSELVAQVVDRLVDFKIKKAPFDKTYNGIISEVLFEPTTELKSSNFGTYKVRFNNMEKSFKLNDGIVHEIGERVTVHMPENNPNRIIVQPTVMRIIPYKIMYDDDNDKFTEYRKIKTNGKTYELESEYKLTVKNKGEENEEVTKLTLPSGDEIKFVNWNM